MSLNARNAMRPRTIAVDTLPPPARLYGRALAGLFKHGNTAELPALRLVRSAVTLAPDEIARYARVCGFIPEHGVPLTFPHVLGFPLHLMLLTDPAFPWSASGIVHLANTINLRHMLCAGDNVRVEVESGPLVAHEKGHAFTLNTRIFRGGEAVWDSDSVYLKRTHGAANPSVPRIESADAPLLERDARWQLPAQLGRDYAKVSGDFNPIHLHALAAKAFGFPRAIAHGMWTLGRGIAALQPAKALATANAQADFKLPVYLPGDVTLWSVALDSTPDAAARAFEVRDIAGEKPHLRGRIAWTLP
jgi:acyl dehydratase